MSQALIVAVVSQKGGVGKSTFDVNAAITLAHQSRKICVIDLDDNQFTSAKHLTRRENFGVLPKVDFYATKPEKLQELLKRIANDFDIIFIESGGHLSTQLRFAVVYADLIVTLMQPFASEFETMPAIENLMDQLISEGIPLNKVPALIIPSRVAFHQRPGLLNMQRGHNPLVALIKRESELKYFKFTKHYIKDRPNVYGRAYELGKSIFELKGEEVNPDNKKEGDKSIEKATQEFEQLFNEVFYGE